MFKILLIKKNFSIYIANTLEKKLSLKKQNIILTGGNTAKGVYKKIKINKLNKKNNYFFSDERCVKKDSFNSNFFLVKKYLFKNSIKNIKLNRIEAHNKNKKEIIKNYIKILPKKIDFAFLSLGSDGHIASIFNLENKDLKNEYFFQKKKPFNRISIGKKIIKKTQNFLILVKGSDKGKVINKYLKASYLNKKKFVLNLFKYAYIALDSKAFKEIDYKYIKKYLINY